MKTKWLVQKGGFASSTREGEMELLERMGYQYDTYDIVASLGYVFHLEKVLTDPDEQFIIRGGTKLLTFLNKITSLQQVNESLSLEQLANEARYIEQLKNGLFYNEQFFDQAYYSQLNLPLLNNNASLFPIRDNLSRTFNTDMFIKPSKDQKAFGPGILEAGDTIESFIKSQIHEQSYIDENALIASCKTITAEYRFFVVDQEVITGSRYRFANKLNVSEVVPQNILDAAREYAKLYQPHDIFTMDLAETPKGISIVEYNCWNASGVYKTDVAKMFNAVYEFKSQQHKLFSLAKPKI